MDEKTEGTIGARVRELRKYKKLNQTEFGAIIGLSQRAIATIETGEKITERNFNAICKELSVNPEWLRTGKGEMFVDARETARENLIQSVSTEFDLSENEKALLKTFLELEPRYRDGVMQFAMNFARTMAAQMNIAFPAEEQTAQSIPDEDLSPEEAAQKVQYEMEKREAAKKEATSMLSASIGLSGAFSKNLIDSS